MSVQRKRDYYSKSEMQLRAQHRKLLKSVVPKKFLEFVFWLSVDKHFIVLNEQLYRKDGYEYDSWYPYWKEDILYKWEQNNRNSTALTPEELEMVMHFLKPDFNLTHKKSFDDYCRSKFL